MLFVLFKAGNADYAIEARLIVKVIPLVTLRACPGAPGYMAGLANYHGVAVPVLDVGLLLGGAPCAICLSSRIILTTYAGRGARQRLIGILAEKVTNTIERAETDFDQKGVADAATTCLGGLAVHGAGFVQRMVLARLAPPDFERMLFAEPEHFAS